MFQRCMLKFTVGEKASAAASVACVQVHMERDVLMC